MKRTIVSCLVFLGVALLAFSCKETCHINRPTNVKPINWEDYNNVYDVAWNYKTEESEPNKRIEQDYGKEIMICGWVYFPHSNSGDYYFSFGLLESFSGGATCTISTPLPNDTTKNLANIVNQICIKLDTCDLTKKCFIKGKLGADILHTNICAWIDPKIIIDDANNIYFEK